MPFFSIILPTFNRAHLLPKAIQSVVDQTFSDWELIIVDDGSTDNTKAVVEKFKDERIHCIYQQNQERSAARNNGINQAKGTYICFLDSDDYFLPEKLMTLNQFINDSTIKEAVFYDGILINNGSEILQKEIPVKNKEENIYEFLLMNPLFSQQICAHQLVLEKNKYNPNFRIGEDLELWLRLAEKHIFIPINNSFYTVIVEHDDRSVSFKSGNYSLEHLKLIQFLYSSPDSKKKFGRKTKRGVLSNCYFNIGKYFMFTKEKNKAIEWITRSLIANPTHMQSKHKLFCLLHLIRGKIPNEYKT